MPTQNFDFRKMLRLLNRHKVDYFVIGGVAAAVHGAPVDTFDLDIVHSRQPANLDRLVAALEEMDAHYREIPHRKIRPTRNRLASTGHSLLRTQFGSLDVLGTIHGDLGYEELLAMTTTVRLNQRLSIRVLNLDAIIASKEGAARDKDKAVLAILRNTLREVIKKKKDKM